jgi:PAS domain S-box-containing protein
MENLLSFFEDASEPFWVIDQSYRLIYGNKSFFVTCNNLYDKEIHVNDSVLDILPANTEHYFLWKSSYDKTFQFKQFLFETSSQDTFYKSKMRFEFKLVEIISKFVCVKGVVLDKTIGKGEFTKIDIDRNEFTLSIDEDGNILRIAPAVLNLLGYFTDWVENKSVIDFLHPDEKDLLRDFFRSNESLDATWCRIRDVNGNYIWCNIQMAAFGKMQIDRKYVITINEVRIQNTPANTYVPDANILQVITEAQALYIQKGNAKLSFDTCLNYFFQEAIVPFSLIAALEWRGTTPRLKLISQAGIWLHAKENTVKSLLELMASQCRDIQKGINQNEPIEIKNGFLVQFNELYFMMYLLIEGNEIVGVFVTSDMIPENKNVKVIPCINYFRPLFVSILFSNRYLKNANAALHQLALSKDELQSLVTSLDDIILEVNAQCELVNIWCNDDAMLSMPKDLMKGKRLLEIKGETLGRILEDGVNRVIETDTPHLIEYMDPLGDVDNWFNAKMNLVKMFNGEKRVSILIRDITEKKEAEQIIAETLQKEKELNEMKSKMITSVSHEFRTPLSTIVSSTELLEMQIGKVSNNGLAEKTADLFSNIYEEVERLSDMMRNFLVMGRFEENQMPFKPKPTDVVALVKKIIKTRFQTKFGKEKIELNIINNPEEINIDPSLFWHILSNLLSNAIKYSPLNAVVYVSIENVNDEIILKVADRGIGIPASDVSNIFKTFYRAGNSDDHSGYGLGLAIVDRFVRMHQGCIEVESIVGEGSTFIVHFKKFL